MTQRPLHLVVLFVLLGVAGFVRADPADEQVAADKSSFTLLNPTPPSLLRPLNTDRPDVTESPYTVDAGHFQAEFSFVEYTYDHTHGARTDGFSVLPSNLKIGVLNNFDLQLILNPYENIRVKTPPFTSRNAGFGDMEIRAKINFWGNDGGETAFGIMPFIRIPTGTNGLSDHLVEGGLIFPFAIDKLPGDFDLGAMAEFDFDHNDSNDDYGVDFIHTVTIGHPFLTDKCRVYGEYVDVSPIDTGHSYLAYVDTGLLYLLTKNVQLDVGINVGLSDRAADFTVFTGLSFRI